ncbi:MAG: hypothetical protein ABL998_24220 [Planctomycetota bacterium]
MAWSEKPSSEAHSWPGRASGRASRRRARGSPRSTYYVSGLAEDVAMRAYVESSWQPFATIAKRHVEAWMQRPEPTRFQEYTSESRNRPHAQELVDRWVPLARRAFGRADSPWDEKAMKLGLKGRRSAELDASFCERLAPLLAAGELRLPT